MTFTMSDPSSVTPFTDPKSLSTFGTSNDLLRTLPPHTPAQQDVVVGPNVAILVTLIVLIIVLATIFLCLIVPPIYHHLRRKMPVSPKRIEARYATIEGWLISKRVRPHDDALCRSSCCSSESAAAKPSSRHDDDDNEQTAIECQMIQPSESYDTAETADSLVDDVECPICMCSFVVSDIVSWSPGHCPHSFHHQCIKQWLMNHRECPYCRMVYLPVDSEPVGRLSRERHAELAHERLHKSQSTYYCAQHGLVTINPQECNKRVPSNVSRSELALMRESTKAKEDNSSASASNRDALPVEIGAIVRALDESAALYDEDVEEQGVEMVDAENPLYLEDDCEEPTSS